MTFPPREPSHFFIPAHIQANEVDSDAFRFSLSQENLIRSRHNAAISVSHAFIASDPVSKSTSVEEKFLLWLGSTHGKPLLLIFSSKKDLAVVASKNHMQKLSQSSSTWPQPSSYGSVVSSRSTGTWKNRTRHRNQFHRISQKTCLHYAPYCSQGSNPVLSL